MLKKANEVELHKLNQIIDKLDHLLGAFTDVDVKVSLASYVYSLGLIDKQARTHMMELGYGEPSRPINIIGYFFHMFLPTYTERVEFTREQGKDWADSRHHTGIRERTHISRRNEAHISVLSSDPNRMKFSTCRVKGLDVHDGMFLEFLSEVLDKALACEALDEMVVQDICNQTRTFYHLLDSSPPTKEDSIDLHSIEVRLPVEIMLCYNDDRSLAELVTVLGVETVAMLLYGLLLMMSKLIYRRLKL